MSTILSKHEVRCPISRVYPSHMFLTRVKKTRIFKFFGKHSIHKLGVVYTPTLGNFKLDQSRWSMGYIIPPKRSTPTLGNFRLKNQQP